jgi:hypothetical protein
VRIICVGLVCGGFLDCVGARLVWDWGLGGRATQKSDGTSTPNLAVPFPQT